MDQHSVFGEEADQTRVPVGQVVYNLQYVVLVLSEAEEGYLLILATIQTRPEA